MTPRNMRFKPSDTLRDKGKNKCLDAFKYKSKGLCHACLVYFSILPIKRPYWPWNSNLVKKVLVNNNQALV